MSRITPFLFAAVFTLGVVPLAHADSETDALRAQIKLLEARLDQLEKKQTIAAPKQLPKQVEERLNIVERKQELAQEDAKAKAEKTPAIEVGPKGLSVTSPDKQYSLRLRSYVQADTRTFQDNRTGVGVDNFLIRTARPVIDAKMTDYFNGRIMLDFGNNQTRVVDAYVDAKPNPDSKLFAVRLGKQKNPVGFERWQSEQEVLFVERGMATNLVPFRDIGVMAMGEIVPDQLEYQIGVTNGAVDLGDNVGATNDNKDFNARIFAHPFRWVNEPLLRGLGVGLAGTYGDHVGTAAASNLTAGYVTPGQSRFFTYSNGIYADGNQWRLNPHAYYYNGPLGVIGEYVENSQRVRNAAGTYGTIDNHAWTAIASYVLTGEDASFDGVKPDHNFDWKNGHWGAVEAVGRLGALQVDKDAYPTFANIATSARNARETTFGLTWYLNNSVKINANYALTTFGGGAAGGLDREDEKVFLTRTQFRF